MFRATRCRMPITAEAWSLHMRHKGAAQTTLDTPMATDETRPRGRVHGLARDAVADRARLATAWSGPHSDQAVQAGSPAGVRHPGTEASNTQNHAGAPLRASPVALEGLTAVLRLRHEDTPHDVGEGRDDFLAALGVVGLNGQDVVCAGLPPMPRLPWSRMPVSAEEETWYSGTTQANVCAIHRPRLTKPTKNPHFETAPQIDGAAASEESRQPPETDGCP